MKKNKTKITNNDDDFLPEYDLDYSKAMPNKYAKMEKHYLVEIDRDMTKEYFSSGTAWEPIVGYSRALKVGNMIYVSGTTSTDEKGELVYANDAYMQTKQVILNIEKALKALGADLSNVVRTRMFVTDISLWQEIGKAHGEFFKDIKPATSMIEISKLISPGMIVEIEAEAILIDN